MEANVKKSIYSPYVLIMGIYVIFVAFALIMDSPSRIADGLWRIATSPSILITDYIELGGIGATLINAVIVGGASIFLMVRSGVKPRGSVVMAIWISTGFAFFGKNVFNMLPITFGVYLFSKFQKKPFADYAIASLMGATLSPVVSEISFMGTFSLAKGIVYGVILGIFVGFVFPVISAFAVKAHMGYCLYNMGFVGGLLATFIVSVMSSMGAQASPVTIWSSGYRFEITVFLYLIALVHILAGIYSSGVKKGIRDIGDLMRRSGRSPSDFLTDYGDSIYINVGLLCALGTTVLLILKCDLNGPTIGCILTFAGFGCVGKHPRNVTPLIIGAILSAYFNRWDPTSPTNTLAILFSTCLAPIAGEFGWIWGIVAGFVHVNMANHASTINSGLNLYNNGFAGGLAAMMLVPVITIFQKDKKEAPGVLASIMLAPVMKIFPKSKEEEADKGEVMK